MYAYILKSVCYLGHSELINFMFLILLKLKNVCGKEKRTVRSVNKSTESLSVFAGHFDLQLYVAVYTAKCLCVFLVTLPRTVCGRE